MPIKLIIKERALLLWEKITRITECLSLWNDSLSYTKRKLNSQRGFLQKVMALRELHNFHFEPEGVIKSFCPTETYDFALSTELLYKIQKEETDSQTLRILLDTLYSEKEWPYTFSRTVSS
ncbi:hypothetical protein TNIN_455111 [Trichonephila inaurata madagascariensis]|uniref:Uncharacterized protein n=1 Tax=Trichonephila inaurata madagascariensis TaxID=2747483 RepID=A0A8X6YXL4_9ARAC|nr:hypothetical protein TNIN_455111 [Trichonephila inaurata madagascariensis]